MSETINPSSEGEGWREQHKSERHARRQARQAWREEHWESRIFGAFTVILIGVVLLLNTTGVISWNVWLNIFRFWPLFIVSAGISIIFGGNRIMKLIGSAISFGIFVVILALAVFNPFNLANFSFVPASTSSQTLKSSDAVKAVDFTDVKSQKLTVNLPIGDVKIADLASSNYLDLNSEYYVAFESPVLTRSLNNGVLSLGVDTPQTGNNFTLDTRGPRYTIMMGQQSIPANLAIKFGAGSGAISLDKQLVKDFNAEVGAGSLNIKLSEVSLPSEGLSLKSGVGNIQLSLPAGVGLKVNYKVGLGALKVDGRSITNGAGSGTYMTENYNIAKTNVELNVEVGLGNIDIVTAI